MIVDELFSELDCQDADATVYIEVDGVVHVINDVQADSQGVYLVVDTDQEERGMR